MVVFAVGTLSCHLLSRSSLTPMVTRMLAKWIIKCHSNKRFILHVDNTTRTLRVNNISHWNNISYTRIIILHKFLQMLLIGVTWYRQRRRALWYDRKVGREDHDHIQLQHGRTEHHLCFPGHYTYFPWPHQRTRT